MYVKMEQKMQKILFVILTFICLFTLSFSLVLKVKLVNPNPYNLTDYQVKLSLSSYISQPTNLIVCTDINDCVNTKLNFCYEQANGECNTTPSSVIWVKVPLLISGQNTTIYIKTTSTNYAVNGDQVFDFYDDYDSEGGVKVVSTSTGATIGFYESLGSFSKGLLEVRYLYENNAQVTFIIIKDYLDHRLTQFTAPKINN
jgi:hypothetical protein